MYEKVLVDGRIVSMAVLIVCGVDENDLEDSLTFCSQKSIEAIPLIAA